MDNHTLELLEFPQIVRELAGYCFSAQGAETIRSEKVLSNPEAVSLRLGRSTAFRRLLESGQAIPDLDFPDLGPLLSGISKKGRLFDQEELSRLGRFCVSAGRLKRYIARGGKNTGLSPIAERIPELKHFIREVFRVVDKEGNFKERNIPALSEIKNRIKGSRQDLERLSRGYLGSPEHRNFWQTDTPTQKDGRTVLPMKVNFKGRIKGIVHEVSASGATIYLEPFDIVEKNNEIIQYQNQYRREVQRILRDLSARVVASSADLLTMVGAVSELDTLYARAVYAVKHHCTPAAAAESEIRLYEARHPLLVNQAVPITLTLGNENRVLIITGPNTGGKTVSLKTVGLLSAMNQFGMEIPVREGSSLCIFDNILADIGDEQSIEQSLSTFSAHIINIARIIRGGTEHSLVLFDELGAGTDPEEGVAIAMALLDYFIEKECLTIATTHHGILKNYGYTRKGVVNASMEFDRQSLTPTFHIIMGIPGESHALEIARRNGIPEMLIRSARNYLSDERNDISELIKRLSQKERELLAAEREHLDRARETDLKELRLRRKELELREEGLSESKLFLKEKRRELTRLIRELTSSRVREESEAKAKEAQSFIRDLETQIREEEKKIETERAEASERTDYNFQKGMEVLITGTGKRGKIIRKGKGGTWLVETETLRAVFLPAEIKPTAAKTGEEASVSISEELAGHEVSFKLDVRGYRLEEAIKLLEQQIDRALLKGLNEFSVVHGKGEGVLQKGIHRYLGRCGLVKDYYFSPPEEGGFGKTIVRLV